MVFYRPHREHRGRATSRRNRGGALLVGALLIAGCIPSSSKYPYREADTGASDLDAAVPDTSAPDAAAPDADANGGCVSPSTEELCAEIGAACGATTQTDRCGEVRTVDCGACSGGAVCTLDNQCCQQQNDASLCSDRGAACGTLQASDNCGVLREGVDCGMCANPDDCEGTSCGACVRESDVSFCERFGRTCGEWTGIDNCGETREAVPCGDCLFASECTNGTCVCPTGTFESACDDDADNDCDGLTDCQDPDCDGKRCGIGLGIVYPKCADLACPG